MQLARRLTVRPATIVVALATLLGVELLSLHRNAAPVRAHQPERAAVIQQHFDRAIGGDAAGFAQVGPPSGAPPVGYPAPATAVAQSPEFAAVRARFERMPEDQVRAAGYVVAPNCVTAPAEANAGLPAPRGNMGFHAQRSGDWEAQFRSGQWDPQTPPILLLDADRRVVGIEWEAVRTTQPAPSLFGQTAPLLPGHGGPPEVNEPHYMLHAYFKPDGMVLFDVFDPELRCPDAQLTGPASVPAAAAPGQVPSGLPRTGGAAPALAALLGLSSLSAGAALRRVQG
jgi:hypothetical protein